MGLLFGRCLVAAPLGVAVPWSCGRSLWLIGARTRVSVRQSLACSYIASPQSGMPVRHHGRVLLGGLVVVLAGISLSA